MTRTDFNHLLSTIKALSPEQLRQLRQQLDQMPEPPASSKRSTARPSGKGAKRAKAAPQPTKKPMTRAEFDQYLLEIGLMSQLPDTEADFDDPDDQLVEIKGEPLSKTIIRERR